jgi:hypothetical protein
MVTHTKTLEDIQREGFDALERALGPIDTLRFLGTFAPPGRDYSRDRHEWVDSLTAEDIQQMVEELRAEGKLTRQRLESGQGNGRSRSGHEDF